MVNVKLREMQETNNVLKDLNIMRRWMAFLSEPKYNELAKQSLNMIITFILASYVENEGKSVCWENFPKIAIYRAYQKARVYAEIPGTIIAKLCELSDINPTEFENVTRRIIADDTDEDFANFLSSAILSDEMHIYIAARKIASYIELYENKAKFEIAEYKISYMEVLESLEGFYDIPGFKVLLDENGEIFQLLLQISGLRNQNRWANIMYNVECSVLGHLLDTAIFGYLMSLEDNPDDEKSATDKFFVGLFHDLAETWTTDFPSRLKDKIPNLRNALKNLETYVIKENVYNVLPEFVSKKIKQYIIDGSEERELKAFLKGADYLSAASESWRQYLSGIRHDYFITAMERTDKKFDDGSLYMSESAKMLHDILLMESRRLL